MSFQFVHAADIHLDSPLEGNRRLRSRVEGCRWEGCLCDLVATELGVLKSRGAPRGCGHAPSRTRRRLLAHDLHGAAVQVTSHNEP